MFFVFFFGEMNVFLVLHSRRCWTNPYPTAGEEDQPMLGGQDGVFSCSRGPRRCRPELGHQVKIRTVWGRCLYEGTVFGMPDRLAFVPGGRAGRINGRGQGRKNLSEAQSSGVAMFILGSASEAPRQPPLQYGVQST